MTFGERLRSVKLASEWMPAKQRSREMGEKVYYDDEALKPIFSDDLSGAERKEDLMDQTHGVGYATEEEIRKHPELAYAQYLDNPLDDEREVDGAA
jgi:hypothetical protein